MKLTIKPMDQLDLPVIMKIEKASFDDPWSLNSFIRELYHNPYAHYLIAVYSNTIAAYIGGWVVTDELHITNLAVSPEFRRKGIARELLKELELISIENGVVRATLEVRVSNKSAIKLYEKFGFLPVGCRPNYYINNNEDALIMWKEITDGSK